MANIPPAMHRVADRAERTRGFKTASVPRREASMLAFLFFLGAALFLEVNLVGRLLLPEAVLAALFPFAIFFHGRRLLEKGPATVIALAMLWLLFQVLTDLVRNTPFEDFSRGWSKIVFFTINFCALYLLIDNRQARLVAVLLGYVLSVFLRYFVDPSEYMSDDPWKFGLGFAAGVGLLVLLRGKKDHGALAVPAVAMMVLAGFVMSEGARSMGAICLATSIYMFTQMFLARKRSKRLKFSLLRAVFILVGGTMLAMALQEVYSYAALEGMFGSEAREKYVAQSRGQYGILLGGRTEIYASSQAVADSPILGHGSWAKDRKYVLILLELRRLGYDLDDSILRSDLIPTHSHLMGAWVEAGIGGIVLWLWTLGLTLRVLTSLYLVRHPLAPVAVFIAINLLWDVLFSPFGHERRIIVDISLIVLLFARDQILSGRWVGSKKNPHEAVDRHHLVQPGSVS